MIIETKNKNINLVLKTRKIVEIANLLKNKNFEEVFKKAYSILDIDECRIEGISVSDLYGKIAEALNEEGFFKKRMTKKELKEMMSNPLSETDMNELVQKSAEKVINKITEEQILSMV